MKTWNFLNQGQEVSKMTRVSKLLAVLIVLVLFAAFAHADDGPPTPAPTSLGSAAKIDDNGNKVLLGVPYTEYLFDAALAADMLQTLNIHRTANMIETNPIEGQHPSESKIIAYNLTCAVLHYVITREMVRGHVPSSIVQAWESGTIGLEMAYVKHNASLGIHFYFP